MHWTIVNRSGLEHILRVAADVSNEREIIVVGSQAVLGQFPEALLTSIEAGLYPRHAPDKSLLIDGAIGELSAIHGSAEVAGLAAT